MFVTYVACTFFVFRIVRNKTSERIRQTLNSQTATIEEAQLLLTPGEKTATKLTKSANKKTQKRQQQTDGAGTPPGVGAENFGVQQSPTPGFTPSVLATPTSPVSASQGNNVIASLLGITSPTAAVATPPPTSGKRKISSGEQRDVKTRIPRCGSI